nr:ribonuclease H-like domain-containing protein [Tanacetum cinerariifolium]
MRRLMEAIEKRLQKLVSQLEIHGVSLSQEDVNLNTTEPVSAAASVSAVCAKMHVSSLPNVDSLSIVMIYSFFASQSSSPQLDNEDLKQIDVDDLEEMELRWQMVMLTMRARRFLQKTVKGHFVKECRSPRDSRRNGATEPHRRTVPEEPANYALIDFSSSSSSFDNKVVSFSKACSKAYAQLHSQYDKLTADFRKTQFDVISYQTGLESVEAILLVYKQNEYVFEENIQLLNLEHVEPSIPVDTPKPASPKPTSPGKRRNRKACFVCKSLDHLIKDCDYHAKKMAQPVTRNHAHRSIHKQYASLTHTNLQKHMVPTAVFTQSKPVPITAVRPFSAVVPKFKVTRPRHAAPIVTKTKSPIRRHITRSPSLKVSNYPSRVTTVKASLVNAAQGL